MKVTVDIIIERLRKHHLYITRSRVDILALIYSLDCVVSTGVITEASGFTFDRITVYRTLQLFCKKGILKAVPSTNGLVEFSLLPDKKTQQETKIREAVFICEQCGSNKTLQLKGSFRLEPPPADTLKQIIIKGLCELCTACQVAVPGVFSYLLLLPG